jgi:mRNA interferase RelE/StbE
MNEAFPRWKVLIQREPEKVLRKLPANLVKRIWARIRDLETDPRPIGCKKLAGYENFYRLRVGDWRVTYALDEDQLIVLLAARLIEISRQQIDAITKYPKYF